MKTTKTKQATTKQATQSAIKLITGQAELDKAIKAFSTTSKNYDKRLHLISVSVLAHVAKHNNTTVIDTLFKNLFDSLAQSVRKNALIAWFEKFGNVAYNTEEKRLRYVKGKVAMVEDAIATPFWEFKPEAKYVPIDTNKAILHLIQRAEKRIEEGKLTDKDNIDKAQLAALKKIVKAA